VRRRDFIAACCCALCAGGARASNLIEPQLYVVPEAGSRQVAITLDACMGATDERILGPLIDNTIPVTLFVTARWLEANPAAIATIRRHPDLFSIQNHGARHVPAVIGAERPYGIAPAGTAEAVAAEVRGGAEAILRVFGTSPKWYRDATALYTRDAMALVEAMGFSIAGFSLNGDLGASASAETAHKRIAGARSGDVVISHINQPTRPAGAGVISGILALRAQGFGFVHLDAVETRA